jgi:methyl-accepting chemotaxis protein
LSGLARSTETKIRTFVISTFLLVSGLILTASGFLIYRAAEDFAIQQYLTQLQAAVSTTAAAIDGERHKQFNQSSKAASAAYRHQLRAVQELLHNKRLTLAFSLNVSADAKHLTYALLPDSMQKDRNLSVGAQFNDTREVRQFLQSVIHRTPVNSKSQHVDFNWLPSQFGRVYMIAAPIYDLKQQIVGVLVVGGTEQQLLGLGSEIFKNMMLGFAVLAVGMLLASILFARKIARPVEQLDNAIRRLIENDFNYRLSEQAFGKFDYLAQQFNLMLAKLHNSRNELIKLNKAYSRFVAQKWRFRL